jgi:excisionase family DNA binding protein
MAAVDSGDETALEQWLTVKQACERAGVSRRTIYNWMGTRLLTWRYAAGGTSRRIDPRSLMAEVRRRIEEKPRDIEE